MRSSSTLNVSLSAFENNIRTLSRHTQTPMLVVVKANAYGHGIERIGVACARFNVAYLGVVQLLELRELRAVGVSSKILVMGGLFNEDFADAHRLGADIAIWRPDQLECADQVGQTTGVAVNVHIKLDTGMGRLGMFPDQLAAFSDSIRTKRGVKVVGVYSHLPSADDNDELKTISQLAIFERCLSVLSDKGITPQFIHIANSPASIRIRRSRFTMTRFGIAAYGLRPTDDFDLPAGVMPIAEWVTRILSVKWLPKGVGVSYGGEFVTPEDMPIGVLPVGYADGFRRRPANVNTVLCAGVELPVIGRICMDFCMVDLRARPATCVEDEVILLGSSGSKAISAESLASRWGTNNYDVMVNIGARVTRRYI